MRVPDRKKRTYPWRSMAALGSLAVLAVGLLMWLLVIPAMRVQAAASVTTLASATLSADTAGLAPGSGAYTSLTGPVLTEGVAGDVSGAAGSTIVLDAPAGFEFNPGAAVTVSVSPTTAAGIKIDDNVGCASPSASEGAIEAAGTITIYFCSVSTSPSTITWNGITVRPISGGPFDAGACGVPAWPSGFITHTGTTVIAGGPLTYGVLAETSGASATIAFTTPIGPGPFIVNSIQGPGTVCVEDQFGNPAVGKAMTWSISSAPAGATCQALIAPDANTNGQGNATTSLQLGHLNGNYEVSASSGAAGPTTDVTTANLGPGAACAPPATATPTVTNTPTITPTPTITSTPTATATNTPSGPTATPTLTPLETVSLADGCNFQTSTYPDNTTPEDLANAVTGTLRGLWAQQPPPTWKGYSPLFPAASNMDPVDRLDVIAICMDGSGTFARPTI